MRAIRAVGVLVGRLIPASSRRSAGPSTTRTIGPNKRNICSSDTSRAKHRGFSHQLGPPSCQQTCLPASLGRQRLGARPRKKRKSRAQGWNLRGPGRHLHGSVQRTNDRSVMRCASRALSGTRVVRYVPSACVSVGRIERGEDLRPKARKRARPSSATGVATGGRPSREAWRKRVRVKARTDGIAPSAAVPIEKPSTATPPARARPGREPSSGRTGRNGASSAWIYPRPKSASPAGWFCCQTRRL
jgi:hypothetical protein